MVKNLRAQQEVKIWFLGWEDPLEEEIATHSSILAWEIHGQRSLTGYIQSMGLQRVGHDLATKPPSTPLYICMYDIYVLYIVCIYYVCYVLYFSLLFQLAQYLCWVTYWKKKTKQDLLVYIMINFVVNWKIWLSWYYQTPFLKIF